MRLHVILGLILAGQQAPPPPSPSGPDEPTVGDADLEKALNADALGASVVTVSSSGDLVIFEGAITIPSERPSVEECGELMSMPPKQRPQLLSELRKKADTEAYRRGMSQRERMTYVQKALEPKRECMVLFKRKCDEIRERVPLEARKAAVVDARKAIDRLLAEERVKKRIQGYLANIIAECPLEQ